MTAWRIETMDHRVAVFDRHYIQPSLYSCLIGYTVLSMRLTLLIVIVLSNSLRCTRQRRERWINSFLGCFNEDHQLRGISFSELIIDTTGKKVFPFAEEQRGRSACRESDQRRVR